MSQQQQGAGGPVETKIHPPPRIRPPPPVPPRSPPPQHPVKWVYPPARRVFQTTQHLERCVLWHPPTLGIPNNAYLEFRLPLYEAARKGDWEKARKILEDSGNSRECASQPITKLGDRVLHIAVSYRHTHMVRHLVDIMGKDDLELKNEYKDTAFSLAALSGAVDIAKIMLQKNPGLPLIKGYRGRRPLHMAVWLGHREMALFLIKTMQNASLDPRSSSQPNLGRIPEQAQSRIMNASIRAQLFDIALCLLKINPDLAVYRDVEQETALHALALYGMLSETKREPLTTLRNILVTQARKLTSGKRARANQSERRRELARKLMGKVMEQSAETVTQIICYPWNVFLKAGECGNKDLVAAMMDVYPDIVLLKDEKGHTIFHIAIIHRREEIFNMIHQVGLTKNFIAEETNTDGDTMLHLAARLPPPRYRARFGGAAFEMQNESMWFKAVEAVVGPQLAEAVTLDDKNNLKDDKKNLKTAFELFTEEHQQLREEGKDWVKKTAESCTLLGSLIAAMVFAAAFQPPGGVDSESGAPVLVNSPVFIAFSICNAMSLFSSSASILLFLSILTSSFDDSDDDNDSWPLKLMLGFTGLLVSVPTMMAAFTMTMFISFRKGGVTWIRFPIVIFAAIPIALYVLGQYPLVIKIFESRRRSRSLYHPSQHKSDQGYEN